MIVRLHVHLQHAGSEEPPCRNGALPSSFFLIVLQSVPVLGYLPFTVVSFVSLAPNRRWQPNSAIFAIFTSQAWNMAFSFHRCVPFHTISTKRAAAFAFPRGSVSDGLTYLLRCRA